MRLKIRDPRVLEFFGFKVIEPVGKVVIEQPLSLWLRCAWWRWTVMPNDFLAGLPYPMREMAWSDVLMMRALGVTFVLGLPVLLALLVFW